MEIDHLTKRQRVDYLWQTSRVPIPKVRVTFAPAPAYLPEKYTAWDLDKNKVYWYGALADKWDWHALYHEFIHAADDLWWTDDFRKLAKPILGGRPLDWPWWWPEGWDPRTHKGPDPYCEALANQMADVCIGWKKRPRLRRLYLEVYRATTG